MTRKRVAILISGRGSNMTALINATKAPAFPAEIVLVVSNKADAAGLDFARAMEIPTRVIESKVFGKDRAAFDAALQAELTRHEVEIVCLAGFMRLLTSEFCAQWTGRLINVHPALLPSFKGLDTHQRAIDAGVRVHGCSTHFVTPGMDEGPIILQAAVPVLESDTEEELALRVLQEEHRIYPLTLKLLASGALEIHGNKVSGAG
jgi:phosphoribosylglycinamide formyltransferase-1